MNNILFLLFLTILISCEQKKDFYLESLPRFVYAKDIYVSSFAKKLEFVPENTWVPILEINLLSLEYHLIKDCLFYYWDGELGQLKMLKNTYSCEDPFLEGEIFPDIKLKKIELNDKLVITSSKFIWEYPLVNLLKQPNVPYMREKFAPGVNEALYPGVKLVSKIEQRKFRRPLLNNNEICHDVDDQCNEVVTYQCHLCKDGWTSEIHGNCSRTFRKRCGKNKCGGKGQVACLRGFKVTGFSMDFCFPDSPIAFCQKGLRVLCKDKTLYCD